MLNTDIKQDLCQISLTGARSLLLLGLLIQAPRSLAEIREEFIKIQVMEDTHSDDILRIDLNTLRSMGCEISRADKRTNNKYVLLKHPFDLDITEEEISLIKRAFNKIKEQANLELLLKYSELFEKIAQNVSDTNIQEQLIGISPLKKYSLDNISELNYYCKNKTIITLDYQPPAVNHSIKKEIIAQELVFKNDKIYLYGYDKIKQESVTLNIKRILKILGCYNNDNNTADSKPVIVQFKLTNFGIAGLDKNETILSGDIEKGFLIEGKYHNEFLATQRILSFGSACTVIEPQEFKEHIIEILKKMRKIYNG